MRLSTNMPRDDAASIRLIHAALDAGVTLLDTADAYAMDATDLGHNERLIARSLHEWNGDRETITVATKGGLTRPGGRWVADGRAKHLKAACQASCQALGVERIELYQLHAPDPRTKLATSVRALAWAQRQGLVRHIGLCNVNLDQLEEASSIADIHSVQIAMGPSNFDAIDSGMIEKCRAANVLVLVHSPLGGPKLAKRLGRDPLVNSLADPRGVTAWQLFLAWMRDLDDCIVPLPGPTTIQHAIASAEAQKLPLSKEERRALDERFPAADILRRPMSERRPAAGATGEVIVVMGCPASGKSSHVESLLANGYARLNRDETGGRLDDLNPKLAELLAAGKNRVAMDNTYPTRATRRRVVETAWRGGVPARCLWMQTSLADAQINAVTRMVKKYGRLLEPSELRAVSRTDPNSFAPQAQLQYFRKLEHPSMDEGYETIEHVEFQRHWPESYQQRAALVDTQLLLETSADAPLVERLRQLSQAGWLLLGIGWQPAIAEGGLTAEAYATQVADWSRQCDLTLDDVAYCPHPAGPPRCWCRPPMPGLVVAFVERYGLCLEECVLVGERASYRAMGEHMRMRD